MSRTRNPRKRMNKMYEIIGVLGGMEEVLDEAPTRKEAEFLWNEYKDAFGPRAVAGEFNPAVDWNITIRKRTKK